MYLSSDLLNLIDFKNDSFFDMIKILGTYCPMCSYGTKLWKQIIIYNMRNYMYLKDLPKKVTLVLTSPS